MKLLIIHGAPCSGKSTYARENITDDDIVYDYDQLSRALTYGDCHTLTRTQAHDFVVDFRLAILKRIKKDKDRKGTCYFLVTNMTQQFLDFIKDTDHEVIEMNVSKEECLERLENDDTRPNKEEWKEKIEEYYKEQNRCKNNNDKEISKLKLKIKIAAL